MRTSLKPVVPLLLAVACASPTDRPPPCETDCEALDFSVALSDGRGATVPLADGARAPWVLGSQGGTMIMPKVLFADGAVHENDPVQVITRNLPDPAAPEAFGEVAAFPEWTFPELVLRDETGLYVREVYDQLGWSGLDGVRMILEVEVRTATAHGTVRGAIELVDGNARYPECDGFAQVGRDCTYREIPGTFTVVALHDAASTPTCGDATGLTLRFTADAPEAAAACTAVLPLFDAGRDPEIAIAPAECEAASGVALGAELRGVRQVIERGTCSPQSYRIDGPLQTCADACGYWYSP